jgi:hypothetical protein
MLHKNGYSSAVQTWQGLLQAIGISVLVIIFLCACNFVTNLPVPTKQPDMTMWTKTESPLFPVTWLPTSNTVWVRYTFAYGNNPAKLMDGAYVTNPLSKTEWKGGISKTTVLKQRYDTSSGAGSTSVGQPNKHNP